MFVCVHWPFAHVSRVRTLPSLQFMRSQRSIVSVRQIPPEQKLRPPGKLSHAESFVHCTIAGVAPAYVCSQSPPSHVSVVASRSSSQAVASTHSTSTPPKPVTISRTGSTRSSFASGPHPEP